MTLLELAFSHLPSLVSAFWRDDESFLKEGLNLHNELRAKHGSPPLKLSRQLCKIAQEWADKLARENLFEHRPNNNYGENIASVYSTREVTAKDACDAWYSEIKYYQFGKDPTNLKAGHFTQLVWKESRELGMGKALSKSGYTYIVANYNPRGNVYGQFASNVLKAQE